MRARHLVPVLVVALGVAAAFSWGPVAQGDESASPPVAGAGLNAAAVATPRVYLPLVMRGDTSSGWVTIVSEDFEGAFPGSWQLSGFGGYTWAKRSCASFAGSYSGWAVGGGTSGAALPCGSNYPNLAASWMVYGPFSLVGATAGDLKVEVSLNTPLQSSDEFCVLASTDGIHFSGDCYSGSTGGSWQEVPLNLRDVYGRGSLMGQPSVWVGLLFKSDASANTSLGAYADNVVLRKCTAASCPGALATTVDAGPAGLVRTAKSIELRQ